MIFDSHAHYDDKQFDDDRESLLGSLLPNNGVVGVINCASTYESIDLTLDICDRYDIVYGSVGIHPQCAGELPNDYLKKIENSCKNKKIVAIGEIGLDYYYEDMCDKTVQKKVFLEQVELAKALSLPIIVHDRDSHQDVMNILKSANARGVIHCFSGSKEMALEAVKLGYYIGLGGVVTFKNAKHSVEVARAVPMERILLETDAPYLSPVPFRGKRNNSTYISYIAEKIAEIKKIEASEVLETSRNNVKNLFGI